MKASAYQVEAGMNIALLVTPLLLNSSPSLSLSHTLSLFLSLSSPLSKKEPKPFTACLSPPSSDNNYFHDEEGNSGEIPILNDRYSFYLAGNRNTFDFQRTHLRALLITIAASAKPVSSAPAGFRWRASFW